jgi:hypothetical protein
LEQLGNGKQRASQSATLSVRMHVYDHLCAYALNRTSPSAVLNKEQIEALSERLKDGILGNKNFFKKYFSCTLRSRARGVSAKGAEE